MGCCVYGGVTERRGRAAESGLRFGSGLGLRLELELGLGLGLEEEELGLGLGLGLGDPSHNIGQTPNRSEGRGLGDPSHNIQASA